MITPWKALVVPDAGDEAAYNKARRLLSFYGHPVAALAKAQDEKSKEFLEVWARAMPRSEA